MLLLATDTSGKQGSLALAKCGPGGECSIVEVIPLAGGTFSAQLVPQIAALLDRHGFRKNDIDGFAVASGPGSFTGLRVGLAAIKALAEVLNKPIAAVSLLEAIASAVAEVPVLAALDAGRGEVYVGEYVAQRLGESGERLLSREEFVSAAKGVLVATPDAALADLARGVARNVEVVPQPRSDVIARLGWKKLQSGETILPADLEANYIRRSDAEIFAKK